MILFYFDWGREDSKVYRMDVTNGEDLRSRNLRGGIDEQIARLISLVRNNRPDKIIFDELGMGILFKDKFVKSCKKNGIYMDKKGSIQYEENML